MGFDMVDEGPGSTGEPMTWIKVEDDFYDHPKFLSLTHDAVALWVTGLAWCSRHRTDGLIPPAAVQRLGFAPEHAEELAAAGLWTQSDNAWRVHEFTHYQRSADEIAAVSAARSEAGRKGAAKRWQDGKPIANVKQTVSKSIADTDTDTDTDEGQDLVRAAHAAVPARRVEYDPSFEQFWSLYPAQRRQGKGAAAKAFAKALKRVALPDLLIAVEQFATDPNLPTDDPVKIPHASTWLNQARWDDGPLPVRGQQQVRHDRGQGFARMALDMNGAQHGVNGSTGPRTGALERAVIDTQD